AHWQKGAAAHPHDLTMHLGLAGLELRAGRAKEAAAAVRAGLAAFPQHPELLNLLVEAHLQAHDFAAAAEVAASARQAGVAGLAEYLQARLHLERGEPLDAVRLLDGDFRR